jgi:fumarate hydratase subunit alpha
VEVAQRRGEKLENLMRTISSSHITETVARLCREANLYLGDDVVALLRQARADEVSETGREVLSQIIENSAIAAETQLPLCQDCGTAVVFIDIGQRVLVEGDDIETAVQAGVARGYRDGYLRMSMVQHPFSTRDNTGDNTPAVIHYRIVPGNQVKIIVAPKGGGSENMSRFGVLKPSQGRSGVIDFVVQSVSDAGANPCPPLIVGVGIGGTAERCMELAKRALLRPAGQSAADTENAELELELRTRINELGIGPQGFGGRITALAVHVETQAAHIASLPVAVNLQCHSARHKEAVL